MGTRHLTCVQLDGEYKIAQYGQWDGYPSGQGATCLKFLHNMDRPKFEARLRSIKALNESEARVQWDSGGESKQVLSRDTGAQILQLVQDGSFEGVVLSEKLAGDSLFCEWAYVIDLDKNTFEVFKGFNKKLVPDEERFPSSKFKEKDNEYHPVRLVKSYSLSELPTEEDFLSAFASRCPV